jgi:hypothetical protein
MTLALDGGVWSVLRFGCALPPQGKDPGTHWIGGWVGLRACLNIEAGGKIFLPLSGIECWSSNLQSDTVLTDLPQLP